MPLTLRIESELDERSATAAASRAERIYTDAAQKMGRELSEGLTSGAREGGRAVEQMADQARTSYKRVGDATDELRKQERLLREMRDDGARGVEVQAERVRQARKREKEAIREAATAYDGYDRAARGAADSATRFGATFQTAIRDGVRSATAQFGPLGDAAESTLMGMSGRSAVATLGVAGVGLAAVAVGKQFYDLGAQWDSISDGITMRTGKIGDELQSLTRVVGDVGSTTAASMGSIGDIVGQLSQSMPDLTANNTAVRQMASNLAFLDANGQAVNIRELGQAFSAFGVNAADQVRSLDQLAAVSRATGIPINELIGTVQTGAPQFKKFGLDLGEATGLLASFENAGLNTSVAVTGLRTALANLSDDARGPEQALADTIAQIKSLSDAGQEATAQGIAKDLFGTRNFAPFLDAIQTGQLNAKGLKTAFDEAGLSISQMQDATDDGAQGFQKLQNAASTALKPLGDFIFSNVNQPLLLIQDNIDKIIHQPTAPITPDSPLGRMLLPAGGLPGMPGTPGAPTTPGLGRAGGTPVEVPNLSPFPWGGSPTAEAYANRNSAGGGPKLPEPQSVPLQYTSTAGMPTAVANAQTRLDEAAHAAAEKQARVNQLRQSNIATEEDIQKALNDLTKAEKDRQQAETALHESRIAAANKQSDQLKQTTGAMEELGADLDADFGISKGLAGIADNVVRFVGSLALAGPMAMLNNISAANPNQGSGLMGILASQGAFGVEYTPAYQAMMAQQGTPGSYSPAGQPGMTGVVPGSGGTPTEAQVKQIAAAFGLQVTSEDRPGDDGYHGQGMALDISNGSGNTPEMRAFAEYMSANFGSSLKELIYSEPGFSGLIGDGKNVTGSGYYDAGTLSEHQNHVHVAADWGSSPAGVTAPYSSGNVSGASGSGPIAGFGTPGSPQAIANMVYQQAISRGYNPHEAQSIVAYAIGESSLNAGISGGVQGDDEVIGLFQQKSAFARAGGIDPSQRADPAANTYAYLNQLEKNRHLPIERALPATSVGGPLASGAGAQPQAWGPLMNQAAQLLGTSPAGASTVAPGSFGWGGPGIPTGVGGAGESPFFPTSPGPGVGGPGIGGALGASLPGIGIGSAAGAPLGGQPYPAGPAGGGIGIGGTAMDAMMAGADLMPGMGAAAKVGIQLANRTVKYAGQVTGILAGGFLDTITPAGNNPKASIGNSWLGKALGGVAGASAALPNLAGGKGKPPGPMEGPGGQPGQPGQQGNTVNNHLTLNNNHATEDMAGNQAVRELGAMYSPPGSQ